MEMPELHQSWTEADFSRSWQLDQRIHSAYDMLERYGGKMWTESTTTGIIRFHLELNPPVEPEPKGKYHVR